MKYPPGTAKSTSLDRFGPLFLYSLKSARLDLAKWILSFYYLNRNGSDRKKLVNFQNELGLNTVFAAIQSGSIKMLFFVLNQAEFLEDIMFLTDSMGSSALHYAMKSKTASIGILVKVLSIYAKNEKRDFKKLMFGTKDNAGNNPFTLAIINMQNVGGDQRVNMLRWIMNQIEDQIGDQIEDQIGDHLNLLFSENKNKEIPFIAGYQSSPYLAFATDYIYEYFINHGNQSKTIGADNAVF